MCHSVFNLQKLQLGSANMVQKKKKEKNNDRMLVRSNLTYLNLIFCGPELTEKK
jgi:hypothetical protein